MTNDQIFKSCSSLVAGTSPRLTIVTTDELFDMLDGDLNDGNE